MFSPKLEEFTQLENPIQKKVKGTGLGLPVCSEIMQKHGGTITVESEVGKGTTFFLRFPRCAKED